jgi:O-antigen/teichoic acid export membrane protein
VDAFTAIPFARLRQQQRPLKFAFIRIVTVFINIMANLFFLLLCPWLLKNNPDSSWLFFYDPSVGVGYAFISNLIASLAGLLLLKAEILQLRWRFDRALLRQMLSYAWPVLVIGLAGMVNEVLDKILLKYLLPDRGTAMAQLGVYGANYKLAVLLTLFIQMFRFAAEPFFFAQAKEANAKEIYAAVMKYFVIFGLFIFLGVMLFLDVVKYLIGPAYHEGLGVVPIVLAANLFMGIFYNLSIWYKLTNLTIYGAVIAVAGAMITLLMNILLIPRIGYWGSAWGHFACYLVMMVLTYLWGRRHLPVNYDLKRMGFYFILVAVLLLAKNSIPTGPAVVGFIVSLLLLTSYLVAAFLMERREFGRN